MTRAEDLARRAAERRQTYRLLIAAGILASEAYPHGWSYDPSDPGMPNHSLRVRRAIHLADLLLAEVAK